MQTTVRSLREDTVGTSVQQLARDARRFEYRQTYSIPLLSLGSSPVLGPVSRSRLMNEESSCFVEAELLCCVDLST